MKVGLLKKTVLHWVIRADRIGLDHGISNAVSLTRFVLSKSGFWWLAGCKDRLYDKVFLAWLSLQKGLYQGNIPRVFRLPGQSSPMSLGKTE